jgi:hypothetical protein
MAGSKPGHDVLKDIAVSRLAHGFIQRGSAKDRCGTRNDTVSAKATRHLSGCGASVACCARPGGLPLAQSAVLDRKHGDAVAVGAPEGPDLRPAAAPRQHAGERYRGAGALPTRGIGMGLRAGCTCR